MSMKAALARGELRRREAEFRMADAATVGQPKVKTEFSARELQASKPSESRDPAHLRRKQLKRDLEFLGVQVS